MCWIHMHTHGTRIQIILSLQLLSYYNDITATPSLLIRNSAAAGLASLRRTDNKLWSRLHIISLFSNSNINLRLFSYDMFLFILFLLIRRDHWVRGSQSLPSSHAWSGLRFTSLWHLLVLSSTTFWQASLSFLALSLASISETLWLVALWVFVVGGRASSDVLC